MMFNFANILFSGPCNARCPNCIGKQVDARLNVNNLHLFPPRNLAHFITLLSQHQIRQVVFSGTNTDPQLYHYEAELLNYLRACLHPKTKFSLHTNGRLAPHRIDLLNAYDKVCISYPSFNPITYQQIMGVLHPPDLKTILTRSTAALKVSILVNDVNFHEMQSFLNTCAQIGIQRLVLRKLYGEKRSWSAFINPKNLGFIFERNYLGNPVYRFQGMQVTLWDFEHAKCKSLNLFSSGVISAQYLLTHAQVSMEKQIMLP